MLNSISLVAKIHSVVKEGDGVRYLILELERPFKNNEGIHEIDLLRCRLWSGIADTIERYYQVGDIISLSGRLESGPNHFSIIVAEQVSFLVKRKTEAKEK